MKDFCPFCAKDRTVIEEEESIWLRINSKLISYKEIYSKCIYCYKIYSTGEQLEESLRRSRAKISEQSNNK